MSARFAADAMSARRALGRLDAALAAAGLDTETCGTVAIAVAEATNNVLEHAYADSGRGRVALCCHRRPGRLEIRLEDRGQPMPGLAPPAGVAADLTGPVEDLPEGGFGWLLIRQLTDELLYVREGGVNRLSLAFDLPG